MHKLESYFWRNIISITNFRSKDENVKEKVHSRIQSSDTKRASGESSIGWETIRTAKY